VTLKGLGKYLKVTLQYINIKWKINNGNSWLATNSKDLEFVRKRDEIFIYKKVLKSLKKYLFIVIHSDGSDTSVDVEEPIKLKVHWIQKRRQRTRKILII
jgi:hypothetical protein